MDTQSFRTFSIQNIADDVNLVKLKEKRIYLKTSDQFREETQTFLQNCCNNIIVDLSQVNVMNSVGLGVLIAMQNEMDKRSGELFLVGLQPLMEDIFTRMRLQNLFNIEPDLATALAKLKNPE